MKEWRISWQEQPYNYSTERVLYVEAETAEDAHKLARDYIERKYGILRFGVGKDTAWGFCEETKSKPKGKVRD